MLQILDVYIPILYATIHKLSMQSQNAWVWISASRFTKSVTLGTLVINLSKLLVPYM